VSDRGIFTRAQAGSLVPSGLPMVANLSGFTDAGSTILQLENHLFETLDTELVVEFENDELLDYRSRRPLMYFDKDHIADYEPEQLGIYLCTDDANQQFLYLSGYEPDLKWDAFTEAVSEFCIEFAVSSFTWVHSIGFPIPHTRSLGVTVSGNRPDLIEQFSEWKPQTQVPGNILHLLEYKLSKLKIPTCGFVLLVPHYLAEAEFPATALRAVELLMSATDLVLPSDALRDSNREFLSKLNKQVSENDDLAKMITSLENGYANEKTGPIRTPIRLQENRMPTADEIANELEAFLAKKSQDPEQDQS
jgi:hypothetical protein